MSPSWAEIVASVPHEMDCPARLHGRAAICSCDDRDARIAAGIEAALRGAFDNGKDFATNSGYSRDLSAAFLRAASCV